MQPIQNLLAPTSPAERMVIVTGPFACGKTTFIKTLTRQPMQRAHVHDFIDYEQAVMDVSVLPMSYNHRLAMVGKTGAAREDGILNFIGEHTDYWIGLILMIDSSKPETFREAKSILETTRWIRNDPNYDVQIIIAANPIKPADNWELEDLRLALRLRDEQVIMPCDAKNRRQVVDVMLALADCLPDSDFVQQLKLGLR